MKIKYPPITGRADDRPKSILEVIEEHNAPGADSVIIDIRGIGVLTAQPYQLPHQPVGFVYSQLFKYGVVDTITTVIGCFRLNVVVRVVGNTDADVSFHVRFLPFCSSLGTPI